MSDLVGCPKCKGVVRFKARSVGAICSVCNYYFSKSDAVEPEHIPIGTPTILDGEAKDRGVFRETHEQMAEDSITGKARENGASYYRNQYRFRERFRNPPPKGRK